MRSPNVHNSMWRIPIHHIVQNHEKYVGGLDTFYLENGIIEQINNLYIWRNRETDWILFTKDCIFPCFAVCFRYDPVAQKISKLLPAIICLDVSL